MIFHNSISLKGNFGKSAENLHCYNALEQLHFHPTKYFVRLKICAISLLFVICGNPYTIVYDFIF